jgi:hypothetical protein
MSFPWSIMGSVAVRAPEKMKKGANVCYYADGHGRWMRREWKSQCSSKVFIYGRCQGVKGHKGVHWCYSPSGSFTWDDNDADPQHDGCAGSTPPGHKDYVSPAKMQKHYFMSHYSDTDVTDSAIIAMLEKDKTPEPDASINRPVKRPRKRNRTITR